MVIQRFQTLLLLAAVILMCIFSFTPYGAVQPGEGAEITKIFVKDAPILLIANLAVAVILVLTIFMYKNLRRQMALTILSIVLIAVDAVASLMLLYRNEGNVSIIWAGGVLLLLVAVLACLWAYRLMAKDRKLLRSYDRMR